MLLNSAPSESEGSQAGLGPHGFANPSGTLPRNSGPSESEGWQAVGVGPHGNQEKA